MSIVKKKQNVFKNPGNELIHTFADYYIVWFIDFRRVKFEHRTILYFRTDLGQQGCSPGSYVKGGHNWSSRFSEVKKWVFPTVNGRPSPR